MRRRNAEQAAVAAEAAAIQAAAAGATAAQAAAEAAGARYEARPWQGGRPVLEAGQPGWLAADSMKRVMTPSRLRRPLGANDETAGPAVPDSTGVGRDGQDQEGWMAVDRSTT